MAKKILIPTDGSDAAEKAADFAIECAKDCGFEAVCMSVIKPVESVIGNNLEYLFVEKKDSIAQKLLHLGQKAVKSIADKAGRKGIKIKTMTVEAEQVERAIIEVARKEGINQIVIGMHGEGCSLLLAGEMGSVTRRLLAAPPPCPLTVIPPK